MSPWEKGGHWSFLSISSSAHRIQDTWALPREGPWRPRGSVRVLCSFCAVRMAARADTFCTQGPAWGQLGSRACTMPVPEPWGGHCCTLPVPILSPFPSSLPVLPSSFSAMCSDSSLSCIPAQPWLRCIPLPSHTLPQANLILPGLGPTSFIYVTDLGELIQGDLLPRARPTCEPRLHSSLAASVTDSDLLATASDLAPGWHGWQPGAVTTGSC